MNHLPIHFLLLAQDDRVEFFTRGFQERDTAISIGHVLVGAGIAVGFIITLWLLSRLIERHQRSGPTNSRLRLFFSLCRAHELAWPDWWLLWRVGRQQRLRDPARLFLEPARFNPSNLSGALRPKAARLTAIGRKIFAAARPAKQTKSKPSGG